MIYKNEEKLILLCSSAQMSEERISAARPLLDQVDWDEVIRIATLHSVLPLVSWNLREKFASLIPRNVLERLEDLFCQNACKNLHFMSELVFVISLLNKNGIEAIPYKGPTLALLAYGNIAFRQFCDLDILVRKEHVRAVKDLLLERGFNAVLPLSSAQESQYIATQCEYAFLKETAYRIYLEVHWDLVQKHIRHRTDNEYWSRLKSEKYGDAELSSLQAEDLLIILCLHGTKHAWSKLGWINDIDRIISSSSINWDEIKERAKRQGLWKSLLVGLLLAGRFFDSKVPDRFIEEGVAVAELVNRVEKRLFQTPTARDIFWFTYSASDRLSDKLRFLGRILFTLTPYDIRSTRLPERLSLLYHLLRPLRLASRYLVKLSQGLNRLFCKPANN
jgi:hypothetical protein